MMVKQKIATITFHRARNYGAVLQAVALQKAIIGLGYDSEVIDYDNRKISSCYDVIQKSSLKIFLSSLFRCSAIKRKNTFFDSQRAGCIPPEMFPPAHPSTA